MTDRIRSTKEGRLGVIALDRPEAINALSPDMIGAITERLTAWSDDPEVAAVLFESHVPRGFCAGGDVRYVRERILAGDLAAADDYFAAEYRMNGLIASYPKPVVAIADGIVMGGGIGIAGHAAFRITTSEAQYAMPESAIGFFADVGVNWILAKAPAERALLFLLAGIPVSGADVLALGLADCCVRREALPHIRTGLVAAAGTGDIQPAIVALLQSYSVQAGERRLCDLADRLADVFALETAAAIVAELVEDEADEPLLAGVAEALRARSPTSLEANLLAHRAARRLASAAEVLAVDLRLATFMARLPDFVEGVRAQLIDRDRKPLWTPADASSVDRAALKSRVAADA